MHSAPVTSYIHEYSVYVKFPGKEHSSDDIQVYAYSDEEVHVYPVQYPSEQVHNGSVQYLSDKVYVHCTGTVLH
jgi:hypothetical protein